MADAPYIEIPNWESFQHYKDREPPWIKTYVRLLSKDEYLALSGHRRAILHGIWLAYATSSRRLRGDSRTLSSRLQLKVSTSDLASLAHAGFIRLVASTALAERLQTASETLALARADAPSQEGELEGEEEPVKGSSEARPPADPARKPNGLPLDLELNIAALQQLAAAGDERTPAVIRHYATGLPEASLARVAESARRVPTSRRPPYIVAALKSERQERGLA